MNSTIEINNRKIGKNHQTYIIAELSANHNQDFDQAVKLIHAAKECGVDAVKLQTYTADTITIDARNDYFKIKGTIWEGKYLYDLYKEAYTPWEWQPELKKIANNLGLDLFSSPFDVTAVDFLEKMDVPVYKIASFELNDLVLIKKIAQTKKPVIMSTGMANLSEINEAITTLRQNGCEQIALLKCTSAYPSPPEAINLRTIPNLSDAFNVPVGLSDHTLGISIPIGAVAIGACIIEKHFTLDRSIPGPDSKFSLEPNELKEMVNSVRIIEKALGTISYGPTSFEKDSTNHRRSIFIVKDIRKGENFTEENIKVIRPGFGLHSRYYGTILNKKAKSDLVKGTPLSWELIDF